MPNRSRYNVLVDGGDGEQLLFNTASGAFAALGVHAGEAYANNACADALAAQLEHAGFLTPLSPDEELAALQGRFEAQRIDHSELVLSLVPTYACNYRCPYCYEQGLPAIKGIMDERTMDAVMAFIGARYAEHAFDRLSVQWYGGDPSLALGAVEELSNRMIDWCDERGVAYDAMILTNCNLIDEDAVQMLARCRVSSAMLTIDGFEETHNKRRVAADGANSFKRVVEAARLFISHGIEVNAIMNVDAVNWPEYHDLRSHLLDAYGIELSCGRLSDCGHFYGTRDFKAPEFVLLEPDEYASLHFEEFSANNPSASDIRALLAAPPRFCNGQRDNYYVIDCVGDVYACDGYVGEQDHVEFNLFDGMLEEHLHLLSHDPFANGECRACELLPICLGNCDWERRTDQMQCHPLKSTLPDYLRLYRSCLDGGARPEPDGITVLVG